MIQYEENQIIHYFIIDFEEKECDYVRLRDVKSFRYS